jgi:heme exporter protein B
MARLQTADAALAAPARSHAVSWPTQAWLVFRKDLHVEVNTGEIVTTSGFFAVLIVVIGAFSFYSGPQANVQVAPGVIWTSIAFASVLALSRTWQREREYDALDGLLVLPVHRSAIFAGKALGVMIFVFVIAWMAIPVCALMLNVNLMEVGPGLLVLTLVTTPGIAAAGTLFGSMTARTSARDLVLASVLLPLLAPALLAAVACTRELFGGTPMSELGDYLQLIGVFDALFITGGLSLFASLIET